MESKKEPMCLLKTINGMVLPTMPDGTPIPSIDRGSINIINDPHCMRAGFMKLQLTILVKLDDK